MLLVKRSEFELIRHECSRSSVNFNSIVEKGTNLNLFGMKCFRSSDKFNSIG